LTFSLVLFSNGMSMKYQFPKS